MIDRATEWLPKLFQSSINANANPIPVADLRKLEGRTCEAFSAVAREMTHSLAIRVTSDDLARVDIGKRIHAALLKSVLKPHDCILLLDFGKAEMSDPEAVSDVSVAQFEKVMGIGIWGQVIWHATSYPERNPATSGPLIELPRTEWSAWSRAISLDGTLSQKLIYGDFAADSSKFIFASGGTPRSPIIATAPQHIGSWCGHLMVQAFQMQ